MRDFRVDMGRPADVLAGVTAGICRLPANGRTATWAASTLTQVSAIRGREAEIAVLGDALERAQSGRRAVVLIEGEAGIGKTRLLDVALEDARRRGMQVAAGRAEELEGMRPFEGGRPSRGGACPAGPGRCWIRRPRSTSASALPAAWPGPRRCCAGRASAAAAGAAAPSWPPRRPGGEAR